MAGDLKISSMTSGTPAASDLIPFVHSPGGTPVNQQCTISTMFGAIGGWQLISTLNGLGGSAASIDFTGIPATFNHLAAVWTVQDVAAGTSAISHRLRFNNDSTSGDYTSTDRIGGQGGAAFASAVAATSNGGQIGHVPQSGNTNIYSMGIVYVPNYANTNFHKRTMATVAHDDSTNGYIVGGMYSFRWASTAAVNRLSFITEGTAFSTSSVIQLYGII